MPESASAPRPRVRAAITVRYAGIAAGSNADEHRLIAKASGVITADPEDEASMRQRAAVDVHESTLVS